MSHKWRRPGHITLLGVIAVLDLLKKQARTKAWHKSNVLIFIYNQAVIAILTKERASAQQLLGRYGESPICCCLVTSASYLARLSLSGTRLMAHHGGSRAAQYVMPRR